MNSNKKNARIAGILYLLIALTAAFGLMYVPTNIIVPGDATTTANNIKDSELLFRLGIMSQLICQTIFVFLVLALYRLLKGINKTHASLMVTLVVVAVPIAFLNTLNQLGALLVLSGADFLNVFEPDQLTGLMMVFLNLHELGIAIVLTFWGLWLIPFGLLVFKSIFIPRMFGVFLIIAGIGYLIASFTGLLFPQYGAIVGSIAAIPSAIGEFLIILWLLIKGVKDQYSATTDAI